MSAIIRAVAFAAFLSAYTLQPGRPWLRSCTGLSSLFLSILIAGVTERATARRVKECLRSQANFALRSRPARFSLFPSYWLPLCCFSCQVFACLQLHGRHMPDIHRGWLPHHLN